MSSCQDPLRPCPADLPLNGSGITPALGQFNHLFPYSLGPESVTVVSWPPWGRQPAPLGSLLFFTPAPAPTRTMSILTFRGRLLRLRKRAPLTIPRLAHRRTHFLFLSCYHGRGSLLRPRDSLPGLRGAPSSIPSFMYRNLLPSRIKHYHKASPICALAGVAQLNGRRPVPRKAANSIPVRAHAQVAG